MPVFAKRYHPPGTAPGTLAPALAAAVPARLGLMDFDAGHLEERPDIDTAQCLAYLERPTVTWLHVQGTPSPALLSELGESLGLHPLALEDVLNTGQRPKLEPQEDSLFVVLARPVLQDGELNIQQVSLFLGRNLVVSFAGGEDPFDPVRARLRADGSRVRARGADYLCYTLVDLVVDEGFPLLEEFGDRLEQVEEVLLDAPDRAILADLHVLRRDLLGLRRLLWPQRDVAASLYRDDSPLIQPATRPYLRDCHDHAVQILELLESYREMLTGMLDIYLSSVSYRLNEVMRVLTIIATLFLPPTFLVGVYGMNFDRASPWNMPELAWPFGYLAVWGVIAASIGAMLLFFRKRKWL